MDPDRPVATGVRAEDGPIRMMALCTLITPSAKKLHPIWNWSKTEVVDAIAKTRLKLARESAWTKRSFDGIRDRYLVPTQKNAPEDSKRILEWFPFVGAIKGDGVIPDCGGNSCGTNTPNGVEKTMSTERSCQREA